MSVLKRLYQMGIRGCLEKFAAAVADIQSAKIKPIDLPGSHLQVWLVDGTRVRDALSIEFIGGGHHYVYPWIPENEVWIEISTPEADRDSFLVHELYERSLMIQGMDYDSAHARASQFEKYIREHPEAFSGALAMVIAQNERFPAPDVKPDIDTEEELV